MRWRDVLAAACIVLIQLSPAGSDSRAQDRNTARKGAPEIVLSGKAFCSLKRQVVVPFRCTVLSRSVEPGRLVAEGAVLGRFRLSPRDRLEIRRRRSPYHVRELELHIEELEANLVRLEWERQETQRLADLNLLPSRTLERIENELVLLKRKLVLVREKLVFEREMAEQDRKLLAKHLGKDMNQGGMPEEGILTAPIEGHVVWTNPEFRVGAELGANTPVIQIGVMDPMVLRAHVHEIEAAQLEVGDAARFTVESLPGRTFSVTVQRISWVPLFPGPDKPSYYEVEFEVPNSDFMLREGYKGRIFMGKTP
ncbi:HlyD family efflux transporter periplasmic adaptor subunit [Thermodesulfobacteriota bacterium]